MKLVNQNGDKVDIYGKSPSKKEKKNWMSTWWGIFAIFIVLTYLTEILVVQKDKPTDLIVLIFSYFPLSLSLSFVIKLANEVKRYKLNAIDASPYVVLNLVIIFLLTGIFGVLLFNNSPFFPWGAIFVYYFSCIILPIFMKRKLINIKLAKENKHTDSVVEEPTSSQDDEEKEKVATQEMGIPKSKKEQPSPEKTKWWQTWWGILILVIVFLFTVRVGHNYLKLKDAYQKELYKSHVAKAEKLIEKGSELNEEQTEKIMELTIELLELLSKHLSEEHKEFIFNYKLGQQEDYEDWIKVSRIYNDTLSKLSDKDKERCAEINEEIERIVAESKR